MGLDMYLTKKTYFWDTMKKDLAENADVLKKYGINPEKVKEICEEQGYWRKANAIHQWFVDNVQSGDDNCAEYYVSEDDIKKLLEVCVEVLKNSELVDGKVANGYSFGADGVKKYNFEDGKVIKNTTIAEALLPTTEGFFFGGTNYDEYYLDDVKSTIAICESALKDIKTNKNSMSFYYQSSW